MRVLRRLGQRLLLAVVAAGLLGAGSCSRFGSGTPFFFFKAPLFGQLSLVGALPAELVLPGLARVESLQLQLDGAALDTGAFSRGPNSFRGTLPPLGVGWHDLAASATLRILFFRVPLQAATRFELVDLDRPDLCEILNNAECMLPYPSSRFLEPAATPTGWRLAFPDGGMPKQNLNGVPTSLSPEPYRKLDGFSPTVQVLMHFPGGVDPVLSGASHLIPGKPGEPNARSYGTRSLDADSPTVLIDADSGEHIIHFVETDARAVGNPARQVLFLRPGRSLQPGHHYIVAVRHLLHPDGSAITPESSFAALRDRRPSTIASLEARRLHFEDLFFRLRHAGVERDDLQLAFDFVVQSDEGLTGQMLSMRDQAFAWLAAQSAPSFTVQSVTENDCSQPGAFVWRVISGTFQVPLFLTSDPVADSGTPGTLSVDADGNPVQNGITNPPFTIAVPCSVLAGGGTPKHPLLFGHGLFGRGSDILGYLNQPLLHGFDFVVGATDWRGLSSPDLNPIATSYLVKVILNLNQFDALPDRSRQGMLNTLVLGRMLRSGAFDVSPDFQTPGGTPVIDTSDMYYFGASLGGILGTMFAGLSPDIERANLDVPAINFSLLLQRATPFIQFDALLKATGVNDPMETALGLSIIHELWVRGESASLATHVTRNPLPGTNAKKILLTEAFLDQQVSNQGTEIEARTLGLPQLVGSLLPGVAEVPDEAGPLDSAWVVYDTGSFDLDDPAHAPFIPPLANLAATPNDCDPHPRRGFIPASVDQLLHFLQPGGKIENFCNGTCDADQTLTPDGLLLELPFGQPACDPLAH
jgi:hypothetical protein